ncbi:aminotransferase class I/II-fold pyridoxal phosphate-dependent enzyme [Catenulispora yoronensis]
MVSTTWSDGGDGDGGCGSGGGGKEGEKEERRERQERHEVWAELARLRDKTPFYDAVIDEQDQREPRRIRIGDKWLADFASCNYLGFDVDPEIMAAPAELIAKWGTHPSWSRLLGNPKPYIEIEEQLTELLQAPDTLVLPTITHIHMTVIPVLAGKGTVFCEAQAHRTIYDGSSVARGNGATLHRWRATDLGALAVALREAPRDRPRVVCMDGINSMTGNEPGLAAIADICRAEGALLYVDDAHGFGVIGERGRRRLRRMGVWGTVWCGIWGRVMRGWCWLGDFRRLIRRCWRFWRCRVS